MSKQVRIVDETRSVVLADSAQVADNPLARLRGLIGRSGLRDGEALVLEPANAIHTHFMRFPIDVLHLDRDGQVLRMCLALEPFRFGPFVARSRLVVEMPAGRLTTLGVAVGDRIRLVPAP